MMPDLATIATIERSSAQLSRLVELWTSNRETAINDYLANPGNYHQPPSFNLELLDLAARILWRLTAVQKTLDTIRRTPTDAPTPEFRAGVQTSVCPNPAITSSSAPTPPCPNSESISSIPSISSIAPDELSDSPSTSSTSELSASADTSPNSNAPSSTLPLSASADTSLHPASAGVPADPIHSAAGFSRLSSTGLQPSNCSIPTIPTIPSVPTIPSLISDAQLHAIAAQSETLFQETQSLATDLGIEPPDSPDPLDLPSLDHATHSLQTALKNIFPKPT